MRIQLAFAALAFALAAPRAAAAEDFAVVVHPSVQVEQLSTEQLSRLFLKKETRWPDGRNVAPVEPGDGPARSAFAARVHRKSLGAIRSYWNQMIFGGRDVPPLERATDAAVVEYVRDHPGAIGYVAAGAATAGVKVVPVRSTGPSATRRPAGPPPRGPAGGAPASLGGDVRLVIRDLKVRHKLLLPAAIAILALALTAGLALRTSRQGDALLRQVEERQAPALELWRDVEGLLAAVQRSLKDAVDAEDAAPLEEADRLHAELLARLDAAGPVAGERAAAVRAELAGYHALARPVTVRLVAGAKAQEVMGDVSALTARFAALRATIEGETARARAEMRAAFAEARALQLRSAVTTGVAALAAMLAALWLATWIASGVSRPLEALEATALRIAREGDLTETVGVEGRDEVGRVAESFRRMVERLRAILLTLRDASEDLSGASGALGELTRGQTELLSRQASGVAETSATTRELEQASAVASQRAEEVLAVARRGGERSDAGLAAVGRSLERIEGIRDGVGRILSRVQDLGARARLVGEIGGTVEDLALQSHVLSINASLEAVRAGEAGKGFAVVAEQVRALANASRASAGRIAGTVRDIVAALDETVALSREGERTMTEGLAEVRASGESLEEIGGVVRDTSAAALQIAAAVQQQGTGVRQIAQAMADIDGGMEVTVERLRTLEGEARRLASTSDRISAVVREFRL